MRLIFLECFLWKDVEKIWKNEPGNQNGEIPHGWLWPDWGLCTGLKVCQCKPEM